MDIIPKSAPTINPQRVDESLQDFRDYMVEVLDLIDFTLSNQKNRISGAVSEENFKQLTMAVQALDSKVNGISSTVSSLSSSVNALSSRVGNVEQDITTIKSSIQNIESQIITINATLEDHESRIKALESK